MKKIFRKICKKIKSWNDYWLFIEKEKMNAAKYTCSSGPLM